MDYGCIDLSICHPISSKASATPKILILVYFDLKAIIVDWG